MQINDRCAGLHVGFRVSAMCGDCRRYDESGTGNFRPLCGVEYFADSGVPFTSCADKLPRTHESSVSPGSIPRNRGGVAGVTRRFVGWMKSWGVGR